MHIKKINPQSFNAPLLSLELNTPLGTMLAISDEHALYFLGFINRDNLKQEIQQLCIATKTTIIPGTSMPIESITSELAAYFNGTLQEFKTPLYYSGTVFQKSCWDALRTIPYGHTKSYADCARAINNKNAQRAVGNANRNNKFTIIIPCHRVINSNGNLGGYNGGIARKQWLLDFEKQHL